MRVVRGAVCLFLALAALPVMPTRAADGGWRSFGPFGGDAAAFAEHPTRSGVVLAGSIGGGLFRSSDGGRTWQRRRGVPQTTWVTAVAFAPSAPSVAFAGSYGGVVYKSTDAGRTWAPVADVAGDEITAIAVHPRRPRTVFIGGEDATYRSTDGGKTPVAVLHHSHDFLGDPGRTIAIPPTRPDVVYTAGLFGLDVSRDGGDTWEHAGPIGYEVVVHPRDASVLYVGGAEGLARSADGGRTFRSVWQLSDGDNSVLTLAIDPAHPSTLYASTWRGLFRLDRGGRDVAAWNQGLSRPGVHSVEALRDGTVLAGVGDQGIYRRPAGADRWRASRRGFINSRVYSVAVPPGDESTVYAGVGDLGVAMSVDHGRTWQWRGLRRRAVWALAPHPSRVRVLHAATDRGVYRTDDGGRRWRRTLRHGATDIAVSVSRPTVVYASSPETGLYRSTDGGATWTKTALDPDGETIAVTVHPADADTVYAGTRNNSVVKSTDGGATWTSGSGLPAGAAAEDIAVDPTRPRRVFASISGVGILRSVDGGATWQHMTEGTPPPGGNAVVVDPRHPDHVYAAVGDGWADWLEPWGVYRSDDGGSTWHSLGLTRYEIIAVAVGGKGAVLYAASGGVLGHTGVGVFTRRVR